MTAKSLLLFFESYYGEKYTGAFLDVMTSQLSEYAEEFLDAAAKVIVKRYSRSYNKAPGMAEIEANMGEILGAMPRKKELPAPELTEEERQRNLEFVERLTQIGKRKRA
jgi:hypothetical protein